MSYAIEARRRRSLWLRSLQDLRQHVDQTLGRLLSELHAIERLELEADRQQRELNPELAPREEL